MKCLNLRQNLGYSLVFVGISTSMFLNYFFQNIHWTPIVMLLSCLLLCDKTTFNGKTRMNKTFKCIVVFQIIMLIYLFLYFNDISQNNIAKQLSFHLYILTLAFVLMRTPSLKERNFIPLLTVLSSLLALLSAFCHLEGLIELERMLYQENAILEIFTCNIPAFISFCCCILQIKSNRPILCFFLICAIIIDLYVIMQSGKRSYYISTLIVGAIYLYKTKKLKQGLLLVFGLFFLMVTFIPEVRDMTSLLFERTIDGITKVYGEHKTTIVDWDDSASIRAWSQREAIKKLESFNLFQYLFGGGYLYHFFDNPLGESYIDMGIIGLCFYFYLIVIIPLKFYFKVSLQETRGMLCFFVSLMAITIIFFNNDPYTYSQYTPLCMMALFSYKSDYIRYQKDKRL